MSQPPASINVSESFQNLPNTVVDSITKILLFLIVLVIGRIVAKVLSGSGGTTRGLGGTGSTGSAGPTGAGGYSQDLGSTEVYYRGTDPGDWRDPDTNYW